MNLQLNDKRALITGSTSGSGFATAVALAREGVHLSAAASLVRLFENIY